MRHPSVPLLALATALVAAACADADNPVALSELQPETVFDITANEIETLEEVEIHVSVFDGGEAMQMHHAEMEIEPASGGPARVVEMENGGDGYSAHVTFYEPGEHHLHFRGAPEGHLLSAEMGDMEIDVHRRHTVIGPYWVEIEISPAPILENAAGKVHILVSELAAGSSGAPVAGLEVHAEIHDPAGVETPAPVAEEAPGEYEAEHEFGAAGLYELHVEIEVDGVHEDGEFHLPVLSAVGSQPDTGTGDVPGGGHGH